MNCLEALRVHCACMSPDVDFKLTKLRKSRINERDRRGMLSKDKINRVDILLKQDVALVRIVGSAKT